MPSTVTDTLRHKILTALAYLIVAIAIIVGWRNADLNLLHAESGLGYWLGISGVTLMVLLILYPVRKRVKLFKNLGPVRHWFRVHMMFGILGPLMIIFHSNFNLGSLNSRIALFCTLVVAGSGIVGRYLYAKLHYGLYGRSASLISLRSEVSDIRDSSNSVSKLFPEISAEMNEWEDRQLNSGESILGALWQAISIGTRARVRFWQLRRKVRVLISEVAAGSEVIQKNHKRLVKTTNAYLWKRTTLLRKFAQYKVFERLFSLWHIVHYPLFLILVVAASVHVYAVHAY